MNKTAHHDEGHHKDEHQCCHSEGESAEGGRPRNVGAVEYTCPMHPEVRSSEPGSVSEVRHGPRTGDPRRRVRKGRVHLPDAPGDRAR